MKKLIAVTAAVASALIQVPARAQDLDSILNNIDFSFGGYGTIGVVRTNTDAAQFIRGVESSGATESVRENVDSNLGVQATARFNSWLAVTAQVLEGSNELTGLVPWAYVKLDPTDSLSFKLGRVKMPLFAVSDSLDVGYANVWLRPPNEVYSLGSMEELNGGEGTYTLPIGTTHLSLTGYVGSSQVFTQTLGDPHARDVHGGEVRWETEWVTLRAGLTKTTVDTHPHDKYTFQGFGVLVDHDNVIAQAEFVKRYAQNSPFFVNSTGWYVLGGYRFDKVAPYVSYATTTKSKPFFPDAVLSADQDTTAIGVRWDAFKSADLKFQFERVDPRGTTGISFVQPAPSFRNAAPSFSNSVVNAASLTLDLIF
ncbi:MAG: hypothetical protein ACREU6_02040 [Steroidobacteraceae bacterium]